MTLFLNFITAVAWIWAIGWPAFLLLLPAHRRADQRPYWFARHIHAAIPTWAWLIVRYWL